MTMNEPTPSRRSFLTRLLGGTVLVGFAGVISAIVAYLVPPEAVQSGLGPLRTKIGKADDLPPGQGKLALVNDEPVWVVHQSQKGFAAFSALCTHKGCLVKWEEKRGLFMCPCHEGRFDEDGNVVSGLPRRPLTRFRVGLVHDELYVSRGDGRQV
jgi:cytochrome b6-f complex iron-sulfur subunit